MSNTLQIKIIKDSKQQDAHLEKMSLEVAKAFVTIVEAVTKIVEHTPDNQDLRISVKKGSVEMLVEGAGVEILEEHFSEVVRHNSTDRLLVDSWRQIQNIISANGIQYEANFFSNGTKSSILPYLKEKKAFRAKPIKRKVSNTGLAFIEGRLIEMGGKIPNIHIERASGEKIKISCSEESAFKARNYIYQPIQVSAWVKEVDKKKVYDLCDSYKATSDSIFYRFKTFNKAYINADDEVESYSLLHDECKSYLDAKQYGLMRKFLRLFIHDNTDINALYTIKLLTQFFRDNERLKEQLDQLDDIFNKKLSKLR